MAGPRLKKIRRLGTPLPGLTRKEPGRRTAAPGQHGGGRHRRPSDYRLRLEEKQKVRLHYGISESQLRTAFRHGAREAGPTGENMLALLERRLDSVVFRLGFAPTIRAARQLVGHGHIHVDGKRVNRAGYRVSTGETIELSKRGREIPDVLTAVDKGPEIRIPSFLQLAPDDSYKGHVIAAPQRGDVPFVVDEASIVEFYAR